MNETPIKETTHFTRPEPRRWSDIRGEIACWLLPLCAIATGYFWFDTIELQKTQMETHARYQRVLEMHTDTVQRALELMKSRDPKPEDSDP